MDKFNNQFATQKLREEATESWPKQIPSRYADEYLFIHDESKPGFYNVQDVSTGKIVGRFGFKTPEKAVEFAKDKIKPQGGRQSSGLGETSMTSAGATFTPGTGEQMATNKAFKNKPKTEEKDVEPKLAAGKAKVYMKDKWGWKDAPSVPNRPSKGGFIYKQLFEELSYVAFNHYRSTLNDAYGDLVRDNNPSAKVVGSAYDSLNIQDNPESLSKLDAAKDVIVNSKLVPQQKNTYLKAIDKIKEYLVQNSEETIYEPEEQDDNEDRYDWFTNTYTEELNENYSKFKNETKTRGKSDQFHQAVREVRRKVQEINRLFEYVSRLKLELSEGEGGLKYKIHTEKALAKIKEMVSELNQNIKKFK